MTDRLDYRQAILHISIHFSTRVPVRSSHYRAGLEWNVDACLRPGLTRRFNAKLNVEREAITDRYSSPLKAYVPRDPMSLRKFAMVRTHPRLIDFAMEMVGRSSSQSSRRCSSIVSFQFRTVLVRRVFCSNQPTLARICDKSTGLCDLMASILNEDVQESRYAAKYRAQLPAGSSIINDNNGHHQHLSLTA